MFKYSLRASLACLVLLASHSLAAHAQTDLSVSILGSLNGSVNNASSALRSIDEIGGNIALRHVRNALVGLEAGYSYYRSNQNDSYLYYPPGNLCPAPPCGPTQVQANVLADTHEITADWVLTLKLKNFRPFALAGAGLLIDQPATGTGIESLTTCDTSDPLCNTTTQSVSTPTQTKPVFNYGLGLDWRLRPQLGIRVQFRGNLNPTPVLLSGFPSTSTLMHSAQPMLGIFYRF